MNSSQKILVVGAIALAVILGSQLNNFTEVAGTTATIDKATVLETPSASPRGSGNGMYVSSDSANASSVNDYLETPSGSISANFSRSGDAAPPNISARAALVADLLNGQTYFDLNADKRWPTASLTKLMTAVVTLKSMNLAAPVNLSSADFSVGSENDFFKAGYSYSVSDVLKIMLLLSKNEAAEALADHYDYALFTDKLNGQAEDWELDSTHFSDPTGLSAANQSSARDLAKLALKIYQNYPKIFETTRLQEAYVAELGSGKKTRILNINALAGRKDFLGGKTGYTDEADGNLLSLFSYQGEPVAVVVLGTSDRVGETRKLIDWFESNFKKTS